MQSAASEGFFYPLLPKIHFVRPALTASIQSWGMSNPLAFPGISTSEGILRPTELGWTQPKAFPSCLANTNTRFEVRHDVGLAIKVDGTDFLFFFFRKSDEKEEPYISGISGLKSAGKPSPWK